jgi:hypothetical protein
LNVNSQKKNEPICYSLEYLRVADIAGSSLFLLSSLSQPLICATHSLHFDLLLLIYSRGEIDDALKKYSQIK